jgi:putative mRNA 3-end processing factor
MNATAPTSRPLFEFHGGLHLRDSVLWFDAPKARQLCFVSHANVSGALAHQKILATDRTAELLRALAAVDGRGRRAHEPQALVTPYHRPFSLGPLSLELFPSGHVLGAASLLIRFQGQTIVYAGDVNPRSSPLVERLEARRCDVLALPSRFGERRFAFPPAAQVAGAVTSFAADAIARGTTPVLFCSPCGEAQELALVLAAAAVPTRAHRLIYAVCRIYESSAGEAAAGLKKVRWARSASVKEPCALLWPAELRESPALGRLGEHCTAFVSGLALDEQAREAMHCDASFALSCHADFAGLLEYVQACQPRRVVLTHGAASELAGDLRALGFEVGGVEPPQQMEMF